MQFTQAQPDPRMTAAHADPDVRMVVQSYLTNPSLYMSELLASVLYRQGLEISGVQVLLDEFQSKKGAETTAREMIEACLRVNAQADPLLRRQRRGAILEALSIGLCRKRSPVVHTEQYVGPLPVSFPGRRSRPLDILVKGGQLLEIYECKVQSNQLQPDALEELDAVYDLAGNEQQPILIGILSLQEREIVKRILAAMQFRCDLRISTKQDLHLLEKKAAFTLAR